MKKIVLTFCLFFIALASIYAQEIKQNTDAPEIKFKSTTHDYGTIIQGADGNCEFNFTNTGKEPLVLSNVAASCGCTIPTWSREPIMPGKEGLIKVHYDTNRIGAVNKQITVMSNAKTDRLVLTITGTINQKPAELMPEKTLNPLSSPINH